MVQTPAQGLGELSLAEWLCCNEGSGKDWESNVGLGVFQQRKAFPWFYLPEFWVTCFLLPHKWPWVLIKAFVGAADPSCWN